MSAQPENHVQSRRSAGAAVNEVMAVTSIFLAGAVAMNGSSLVYNPTNAQWHWWLGVLTVLVATSCGIGLVFLVRRVRRKYWSMENAGLLIVTTLALTGWFGTELALTHATVRSSASNAHTQPKSIEAQKAQCFAQGGHIVVDIDEKLVCLPGHLSER